MENFKVYWNDELVAKVDIRPNKVFVDRYTKHPLKQIFPKDEITRYEFGRILAARCWEEKRADIALILKELDLREYNIYEIMRKTHGVSYNDSIWFQFDGEELSSDQVLIKRDQSFFRHFDASVKVDIDGTSEGTQGKYYSGGYWYKTDSCGGEAYSECLSSLLLEASTLEPNQYVTYEYGEVNRQSACRSKNFLSENEEFITLYRLFLNTTGKNLSEHIHKMNNIREQSRFVLDFVKEIADLDLTEYFANTFALDMLILNEDRHFNNLGVIFDGKQFKEAPIFDNGKSLFVGNYSVNRYLPIAENLDRVISKPFFGTHEAAYRHFQDFAKFRVDAPLLCDKIETSNLPECLQKEVLLVNLHEHKELWK